MLSIIIPTFQEEKSIINTLKVINEGLTKEMFEFEIIVVDDNSYDQTKKIISNFSKINPNIHFYLNSKSLFKNYFWIGFFFGKMKFTHLQCFLNKIKKNASE